MIAVLAALLLSTPAHAWWDPDWTARAELSIENATLSVDIAEIVALVELDPTRIDYAAVDAAGDDLRFVDGDDLTELSYDVEVWDPGGTSLIWVRIPLVEGNPTADQIYLYWGNPAAAAGEDEAGTWGDGNHVVVHHFDPGFTNPVSGLDGVFYLGAALGPGLFGDSLSVDGVDDYFKADDYVGDFLEDPCVLEFWINTTDTGNNDPFLAPSMTGYKVSTAPADTQIFGWLDGAGHIGLRYGLKQTVSVTPVNDGDWHHVALVRYADGDHQVWVDGALEVHAQGVAGVDNLSFRTLAYYAIGRTGALCCGFTYIDALIDEYRIHTNPRTPDEWYEADWLGQSGQLFDFCTLDTFGIDADGDGHGSTSVTVASCDEPPGYGPPDDCNDANAAFYPGAVEICESAQNDDEDCDGLVDEADPNSTGSTPFYEDADGDGYGDPTSSVLACVLPAGYVLNDDDCNDASGAIHPGVNEDCDGVDDDCDGAIDDNPVAPAGTIWYPDADDDGYGGLGATVRACTQPAGYFATANDCDEGDPAVNPGANEDPCNGVDDDCDLQGGPADDSDGDGASFDEEDDLGGSDCDDDSDDDGVLDVVEFPLGNSDGDLLADLVDPDDDGDTIPTALEGTTNPDGDAGCAGTTPDEVPNYLDDDSDGDGLPDILEGTGDLDGDTIPNYLDCYDYGCAEGVDGDVDGLDECEEVDLGLDPTTPDTDDDGVVDGVETGNPLAPRDTDGDQVIDGLDPDDDGDGLLTALEDPDGNGDPLDDDTDGDTDPDFRDDDDDDDGWPTASEDRNGNGDWSDDDLDGDGTLDHLDGDDLDGPTVDADGDGLINAEESLVCADGACLDPLDADSDGDGVDDLTEVGDPADPRDTDGDGLPDALDGDDDGDGVPTAEEGPTDADGDGVPAWRDPDADGDGNDDGAESATLDADCDGIADRFDPTADGVCGGVSGPGQEDPAAGCDTGRGGPGALAFLGLLALRRRR